MVEKCIVCMLKTDVHDHTLYKIKLGELRKLLNSLNVEVAEMVVQSRIKPTSSYLLGRGKAQELANIKDKVQPDFVVFYNTLSSKQRYNLEKLLKIPIYDRFDVTLKIFQKAATDSLSKTQIELADLVKSFPYVKFQASMKYLRHRAGFKGGGEYAYHRKITALHKRIKKLRVKIEKIKKRKLAFLEDLKERGVKLACLSGYYNAGKTSLFNLLTGVNKPVSDMPFTTLSSKYSTLGKGKTYLVDTIGFVLDQDPRLISSFQINLMDIENSDTVLILMDISDPPFVLKIKINEILDIIQNRLKIEGSRLVIVLNKLDKIGPRRAIEVISKVRESVGRIPVYAISVKNRTGISNILQFLSKS